MKKRILFTHQGINGGNIPPNKPAGFVSLNFDNCKLTIDAYKGAGLHYIPRETCLITLADEKTVHEFDTETLFEIIRFFVDYSAGKGKIVTFRNKYHYIVTEEPETAKKG
ncbi:MAG: hypothetical protein JXA79_03960 [Deltaproteobacteria bacterium]|nr:hypothetical protein [Deltaproteobacteria bacterium]